MVRNESTDSDKDAKTDPKGAITVHRELSDTANSTLVTLSLLRFSRKISPCQG